MKKLTINGLQRLLQDVINENQLGLGIRSMRRTRYRRHEYEAGACYYHIWTYEKQDIHTTYLYLIFSPLSEIEKAIKRGFKFTIVGDEFKLQKQD
jgi:hypothetical protein